MSTKQLFSKRNQQIRQMWADGHTRRDIAGTWDISCKQVRKIVNFKEAK